MISISYFTTRLAGHALTLSLIIVMMTTTLITTITISSPTFVQSAFADHGQEIVLTSKDASFAPVSSGEGGNQAKVVVNYVVHDPMIVNDLVKGVMKVYSPNGTLLKTSSSPTPFPISNSYGTATLATTLTDPTIESVIAKIAFTNPIKTETFSNELPVSVDLIRGAALSGEPQEKITPQAPPQSEEEAPIKPILEDKLLSTESTIVSSQTEEEQQPDELKEVPIIQAKQQTTSIESMPQTITNPSISPTTTTTYTPAPHIAEEICNDGIDNDSDTLIDFSDEKCNPLQSQQQRGQPILQQGQTIAPTPEICDDDLDNDFDGKVDSRDEECSTINSPSSFPSPRQAQSVTDGQTEGQENDDKEQQSTEDVPEESGVKEDGYGQDNKEDDRNDDENEDEDTEQQSDDEDNDDKENE
ncbi:MAG TPA: hypothetical protein VJ799_06960 [Nitrososphaeraceae archaeon]|nr:hypothetical protein [Nitrososphaeraceae archaeon]